MSKGDDFDFVASLSTVSGLRQQWTTHDTAAIEQRFSSRPKISNKKEIIRLSGEDQVLSISLLTKDLYGATRKLKAFTSELECSHQ